MNYEYFEYDGAVFRRKPTGENSPVTEVKNGGVWRKYTGEGLRVVFYGDQITEEEASKLQN